MAPCIADTLLAVSDVFMPRACVVCGRRLTMRERQLCLHCEADVPYTYFWQQTHNPMADRLNEVIQRRLDASLPGPPEPYAYAAALFHYHSEAGYKRIPQALKYDGDLASGRLFARRLGALLAGAPHFSDVDCVIPVPLHWTRLWQRGYNQASVIASCLAEALGAPLRGDILLRRRRTRTQTRLSVGDKALNVASAFRLRHRCVHGEPAHILLVDDVFTTGATIGACIAALRTAVPPSVRISAATLAFVSH